MALLLCIAVGCTACRARQPQLDNGQTSESFALDVGTEELGYSPDMPAEEDGGADTDGVHDSEEKAEREIEARLEQMTLEEKVAQLFIVTPESLVGVSPVTSASEMTQEAFEQYPVGGFVYFENNLLSGGQVKEMRANFFSKRH